MYIAIRLVIGNFARDCIHICSHGRELILAQLNVEAGN
jgi:hypothetical protein